MAVLWAALMGKCNMSPPLPWLAAVPPSPKKKRWISESVMVAS
jgi:hypothetical protein